MVDIDKILMNDTSDSARSLNASASIIKYHTVWNDVHIKTAQIITRLVTSNDLLWNKLLSCNPMTRRNRSISPKILIFAGMFDFFARQLCFLARLSQLMMHLYKKRFYRA